jgi:hypothetical protein
MDNSPVNIIVISEKEEKKYYCLKEKEDMKVGDLVHIVNDKYAQINEGCILAKKKASGDSKILRKK